MESYDLDSFFNLSLDMLCIAGMDGYFKHANPAFSHTLGWTTEQLLQAPFLEFIHPEDVQRTTDEVEHLSQGRPTISFRNRYRTSDGTYKHMHWTAFPDTKSELIYAIARDETQIVEARRRFELAVEASPTPTLLVDSRGEIILANLAAGTLFGYDEEEMLGQPVELLVPERLRDVHKAERREFSRDPHSRRMSERGELIARRKDGQAVPVEVGLNPIHTEEGLVTLATIVDLTTRKDQDRKREILEQQLRHAQKMEALGRLTGGVAHDLNNVLTAVLANAELLNVTQHRQGAAVEDVYVSELVSAAKRGAMIVKKLLAFSRTEQLALRPINVADTVSDAMEMLRGLLPASIQIESHLVGSTGIVLGDPQAIEQILVNLATNARDVMPDGGTLSVSIEQITMDDVFLEMHGWGRRGEFVQVAVNDSGPGMDAETQSKVFEPFFTTKTEGAGSGLGLSMVYGLVKHHDGFVDVRSAPDGGTTVTLYFPITHEPAPRSPDGVPIDALPRGTETVLVVEDEAAIRSAGQRLLEKFGYRVLTAENGEDALVQFQRHDGDIDVVVCDVVMPKLSGPAFRQKLLEQGKTVPFLFTSGYTAGQLSDQLTDEGNGLTLLPKPWSVQELLLAVRTMIDSSG